MNKKVTRKTSSYTVASFYNRYLECIEPDTLYDISYEKYKLIIIDYFKYLRALLLYNSKAVRLPYRMGIIQIVKHRPKHFDKQSLRIDYKSTKEYNKLIYFTNEHSNYYKYRCYWDKSSILTKNKCKYQLCLTRDNKRELALIIKNNLHDYLEL